MESYTPRKVHGLRKTAFMGESLAFTLPSGKLNCEEWKLAFVFCFFFSEF